MSWTRLDDGWTDSTDFADLDHATRWHYLAMIQFCSRTAKYDGRMRHGEALRCSDVDDPNGAISALAAEGLIEVEGKHVRVVHIEEHVPSPAKREETERAKVRKQRSRRHQAGDHSTCLPAHCDQASMNPVTRDIERDVTRDVGTGRAGTGSSSPTPSEHDDPSPSPAASDDERGTHILITPSGEQYAPEEDYSTWPTVDPGTGQEQEQGEVEVEDWFKPFSVSRRMEQEQQRYCRAGGCANRPLPGMDECVDHVPDRDTFEAARVQQLADLDDHMNGGRAA